MRILFLSLIFSLPVAAVAAPPGRGIPPRDPGEDRIVSCFARSSTGETFSASGDNARIAQMEALRACQAQSRFCRAVGCH